MPFGGVYAVRTLLCVNVDHMAVLRQAQGGNEPDPVEGAIICEKKGCGISVHLREDRRYIQDRDVFAIRNAIGGGKLNLEIPLSDETINIVQEVKPNRITIVPEKREEMTTEGGLDVKTNILKIQDTVRVFHDRNVLVSLCIEPSTETIELSKECGADFVEIHTGAYCRATDKTEIDKEIKRIYDAANHARKVGIKVNAGHGLTYRNIEPILDATGLLEVTIGRSIISRSAFAGLSQAVEEMLELLE